MTIPLVMVGPGGSYVTRLEAQPGGRLLSVRGPQVQAHSQSEHPDSESGHSNAGYARLPRRPRNPDSDAQRQGRNPSDGGRERGRRGADRVEWSSPSADHLAVVAIGAVDSLGLNDALFARLNGSQPSGRAVLGDGPGRGPALGAEIAARMPRLDLMENPRQKPAPSRLNAPVAAPLAGTLAGALAAPVAASAKAEPVAEPFIGKAWSRAGLLAAAAAAMEVWMNNQRRTLESAAQNLRTLKQEASRPATHQPAHPAGPGGPPRAAGPRELRHESESHPQTAAHPQTHPGIPSDRGLFPDLAGAGRRAEHKQSHRLRTRGGAHPEGRLEARPQQGTLFGVVG